MSITKTSSRTTLDERTGKDTAGNERWSAVMRRDASVDGKFYYSVKSTGVYCRPSCAARRPLRESVRFHAFGEDAELAGFRACKRCQP